MADTIKKAKLAVEDIHFDTQGTGSTVSILKSDGNFRTGSRVNAGHIPSKTATRAKTRIGSGTPATTKTDVDAHIAELYDDLAKIGEPDASTVEVNAGILRVKDAGITAAKLLQTGGSEAVITAAIRDDAVTNGKIGSAAVVGSGSGASGDNVIQANTIGTAELGADCVTNAEVADNAIQKENLADNSVGVNELDMDGSGTPPVVFPFKSGTHSDASTGTATFTASISGVLATDIVIATVKSLGTGPAYLATAACTADTITFVMNANQTAGTTEIQYVVYRAASA